MALPLSYNVRNVIQRPAATLTTAIGVGLTVAILIGALSLAAGFQAALIQTGSPENVIALRTGADSEISSGLSRETVNILRAHPAVAAAPDGRALASPEVLVLVNKPRKGMKGSSNVSVRGLDLEGMALREGVRIVEGRLFAPGADEVVIGQRIARRFEGCAIGDRIRFGAKDFTVVGHFTAGGSSFESEIWGDNRVLMPVFRGDFFQSLTFRVRPGTDLAALERELEADPRLGVQIQSERAFYAGQSTMLATTIRVAGVFIVLIMAAGAVFGAMNTMFAAVGQRTREIATLMILGFRPGAILVSFMIESVILSLIGGVIGCLIALPINGIVTSTTNFASFSEVAFAFRVTPAILIAGLAFSAALGLVGGFLPALRASRRPLAASLREM